MSSKTKKGKKKVKNTSDTTKSKDVSTKKIQTYFSNEDIVEVKTVLKTKDISGVPFVIAATILHKFELLKRLLKDGYNVNQTGNCNMTALLWAVKYKYLDFVDYLLTNGADPTIKTDSGDNVLIIALEHKLWDEQSFINLWKAVKKVSFIDINFANKNGHNMLHMCVRRDWEELLKILLAEKPDIDASNSNGVTPLMLACFRNNMNIINILLDAGSDILKEDNHGRMTLCYAISSSLKLLKPPFTTAEKIIEELKKKSSLELYLTRRIELIMLTAKKSEIYCATSEMLIKTIQFTVQFINEGVKILLNCNIFDQLVEAADTQLEHPDTIKFILEVAVELLFYNEQSQGYSQELYNKITSNFFESGFAGLCLEVIKKIFDPEATKTAFNLITLAFTNDSHCGKFLEENGSTLLPFLNDNQSNALDETRLKILKNKRKKLKKVYEGLEIVPLLDSSNMSSDEKRKFESGGPIGYSKKSRRRSRAMKAKLSKMKTAELTKRYNLNGGKNKIQQKVKTPSVKTDNNSEGDEASHSNPIVCSLQHLLEDENAESDNSKVPIPEWKQKIVRSAFNTNRINNLAIDYEKISEATENINSRKPKNVTKSITILTDYLRQLLQEIVEKYLEHWQIDHKNGQCTCLDIDQHGPIFYALHLEQIKNLESQMLQDLQHTFEYVIRNVTYLGEKNVSECLKSIYHLEGILLNYEIRGVKLLSYVSTPQPFRLLYNTDNKNLQENDSFVAHHVQNVLNDSETARSDLDLEVLDIARDLGLPPEYHDDPSKLYEQEMQQIGKKPEKNTRKEMEARLNTIANGFHLINSTMSMVEESNTTARTYCVSDLDSNRKKFSLRHHQEQELNDCMPERLRIQTYSLQRSTSFVKLLNGQIRMAKRQQCVNYVIGQGVNFDRIELGLDVHHQPLAVKKVARQSWFGKLLKSLIRPLIGLMDTHILHYFACECDADELILATPLCRWNIGQFVQMLRYKPERNITTDQIARQFLHGMLVLHKCDAPIIHGNLKPTNIFIDFNGLVKIAEFGIHKALYKMIQAPVTSQIWFAKETLDVYLNYSIMECSLKSDVHVAGMLLYFIMTYGKHPYGDYPDEILANMEDQICMMDVKSIELADLVEWMITMDAEERPSVEQALAHPFFWSVSKKWNFVLCCSGITPNGYILPINIDKLHRSIDAFSDPYLKYNWQDIIKQELPNLKMNENCKITGLLKFIKYCYEHKSEIKLTDCDMSCVILTFFPGLPVLLYRTLQHTNWLKNAVFLQFASVF